MNYDKLKEVLKRSKWSVSKACRAIDMSESWFYKAIENDTMTISDLEKLLKLCKTSLSEFFGNLPSSPVKDTAINENELLKENNELLRENRQLRLRIEEMEGKRKSEPVKPKTFQ